MRLGKTVTAGMLLLGMIQIIYAGFDLTVDGKPNAVIVYSSNNIPASAAAEELQYHIVKMSGAQLPIVKDNTPEDATNVIYIGFPDGPVGESLVAPDKLPPEGYVLKSIGNTLYLYGDDTVLNTRWKNLTRHGTFSAVSHLLEKYLGCRWFMPTALGEYIPSRATVTLPQLDEQIVPPFSQRNLWVDWKNPDEVKFYLRHRLGQSVVYDGGHAFEDWYPRFSTEHPEFFALQPDGTRIQPRPKQSQLCLSNTQIDPILLNSFYGQLSNRKELFGVSAGFNDAGESFFCICPECRKLDPPNAPLYNYYYGTEAPATDNVVRMPAITDRYMTFVNRLAKPLADKYPDKTVVYTAYRNGISAPLLVKPADNVMIYFAGFNYVSDRGRELSRDYFSNWRKLTDKIIIRPNFLHHGAAMPLNYGRKMVDDFRFCSNSGVKGFSLDAVSGHWGSAGIHYYFIARLLNDPQLSYQELLEEYCNKFYGSAATQMLLYFDELEQFTNKIAATGNSNGIQSGWGSHAPDYYTQTEINRFRAILQNALNAATDPMVRQRIELNLEAWEYAELLCNVLRKVRETGDSTAADAEFQALDQWRSAHTGSLAINTQKDYWRWSCRRNAAKPSEFWNAWDNHAVLPQEY